MTGPLRGGPARHGIKFVGYCELLVNYPIRQAMVVGQSEHRDLVEPLAHASSLTRERTFAQQSNSQIPVAPEIGI